MNPRFTVLEVAEKLGVEKEDARGLVKFLVAVKLAIPRGLRKPERGAPEKVYSFVDEFEKPLCGLLKRAGLS